MKQECKSLKMAIGLSVIFFFFTSIFGIKYYFEQDSRIYEILLNTSIGLLSSTIVAVFFNYESYQVAKKETLKKYYECVKRLMQKIEKVTYIHCEYNQDALYSYLYQLWIKENQNGENIRTRIRKYKSLLVFQKFFNIRKLNSSFTIDELIKIASKEVDEDIVIIRKESSEIFQQYITLSKEEIRNLDSMLGDMEFINGKKIIERVTKLTYKPISNVFDEIKIASYFFELYLSGKNNEADVINRLLSFQKVLFGVKITDSEKTKCYAITNDFVNKMYMNLEELRAIIYGVEPIKLKFLPKICITINKF